MLLLSGKPILSRADTRAGSYAGSCMLAHRCRCSSCSGWLLVRASEVRKMRYCDDQSWLVISGGAGAVRRSSTATCGQAG